MNVSESEQQVKFSGNISQVWGVSYNSNPDKSEKTSQHVSKEKSVSKHEVEVHADGMYKEKIQGISCGNKV